jgi:hypothetical protein
LIAGRIGVVIDAIQQEIVVGAAKPIRIKRSFRGVALAANAAENGDRCTLVESNARSAELRPFGGSSATCWVLIPGRTRSNRSPAKMRAGYRNLLVTTPTCRAASTRWRTFTFTTTSFVMNLEKPVISTLTEYRPTLTLKKS